jgi:hypothetical protein
MHRCLDIPEIVTEIFRAVQGVTRQRSYLKTLSSLAVTKQGFSDVALDLLWESQTSLAPLVACLPADAVSREGNFPVVLVS